MEQPLVRTPNGVRTVGVEEELLLVDPETGAARSVASQALRIAERRGQTADGEKPSDRPGGTLGPELQEQQLETDTPPEEDLDLLARDLDLWRVRAQDVAARAGALVLASGTAPLQVQPTTVDDPRYAEIREQFGLTAREQLSCGCHVHVSVESEEEAIGALDRLRAWLPVLLAMSTNSPFWQGVDSGYESYRSQVMTRWPTNGPTEVFGSADAYASHLRQLVETGVPLDEGMAYFDARPSARYPTLELRIADVCLDPRDAVVLAALCRALVATCAREWRDGVQPIPASVTILKLANWQAGRRGLTGDLLDPRTQRPRPSREVLEALAEYVAPELEASGDLARVEGGLRDILQRGPGSARQREELARWGRLDKAVIELARISCDPGRGG